MEDAAQHGAAYKMVQLAHHPTREHQGTHIKQPHYIFLRVTLLPKKWLPRRGALLQKKLVQFFSNTQSRLHIDVHKQGNLRNGICNFSFQQALNNFFRFTPLFRHIAPISGFPFTFEIVAEIKST